MTRPDTAGSGRWDGLLCGLIVVLAILLGRPFLEMGLIDDFSYIQTAFTYARTGHFVYNGWATAMLGWQIPWGALFVKIFGYHVWPLHLSTLVLAGLCMPLLHAVMRRSGLNRSHATLATLLTGLSPIFLPLASTFMTDIGGLLSLTLCWYGLLRALDSRTDRSVWIWLTVATAASVAGGTARQIVWVGALTMMPATAWLLRRRKGVVAVAISLWVVSIASVMLCLRWFKHQRLSVPEPIIQGHFGIKEIRQLACTDLAGLLCLVLLVLPVFVAAAPPRSRWTLRGWLKLCAATVVVTLVSFFITFHINEHGWMPWTGDIVERLGILDYPSGWLLGLEPMMFSHTARVIGSYVVIGIALAGSASLWRGRVTDTGDDSFSGAASWRSQGVLLGGLLIGYLGLLQPRAIWFEVLDRYLLPLIPVAALIVLRLHQERLAKRIPSAAWAMLAVWGLFATMGTHDWLASHRARLTAIARLGEAGIPPEHINAGYEINGMTQIRLAGTIIDPRVTYPPDMHVVTEPEYPADLPKSCYGLIYKSTPMVKPQFFLAHQIVPCLEPSSFGAVPYRTWLPPYDRSIHILQRSR
jgi:hypothetical protein